MIDSKPYNDIILDHFKNPRNTGDLENPDAVETTGSPVCGDFMKMSISVDNGILTEVHHETFGCAIAIASGSIASELATGKSIEDALQLTPEDIANALGGVPASKMHCCKLAVGALKASINKYLSDSKE